MQNKTVYSFPAMIALVVELTKQGKTINRSYTRGSYGSAYVVSWEDDVVEQSVSEPQTLPDVSPDVLQEIVVTELVEALVEIEQPTDFTVLSIEQLRKLCDDKGLKYNPANKEPKLIEILQG